MLSVFYFVLIMFCINMFIEYIYIYYMLGIFVYMEFVCVLGVNIGILA